MIVIQRISKVAARAWSRRRLLRIIGKMSLAAWLIPVRIASAEPHFKTSRHNNLRIIVDALLPADEFTPAASVLDVHTLILEDAENDPFLQYLIDEGLQWLEQSVGSLILLDSKQLDQVLQTMSDANWDTVPKNFFYQIRDRAVFHYYANPLAWAGSVINRPPQPLGYPETITFK